MKSHPNLKLPKPVKANVEAAEFNGHSLVSQGSHSFLCTRCKESGFLDSSLSSSPFVITCRGLKVSEPPPEEVKPARRPSPILSVNIYVDRTIEDSISDEENDAETSAVHALAATFPESIRKVRVCDREGEFLYYADSREG